MTNTLNRSGPLLVLKFPGRPLDIIPITTPLVYGQKKGAILSNNVGHEFERVITRQEHGIPKQSKHFRVVRFRFGQLSLALTKEGMSNFSKFALAHKNMEPYRAIFIIAGDLSTQHYLTPNN
jgi:hypothetical protein